MLVFEKDGGEIGAAVAVDLGISPTTAWRLLSFLRENDGRVSALLPKRSGPKLGSLRLSRQVEDLVDQVLRERYLVLERPSFARVVGEIRAKCSAKEFPLPWRQTVKARLEVMISER